MSANIERRLAAFHDPAHKRGLEKLIQPLADCAISQTLTSAALVIKTGGSALAKTGSADTYAVADGVLVKISASTDMPALTGLNITATKFNVFVFFVDSAGALSVLMGREGADIGHIQWPAFPSGKAPVGFLIVTYASTFTGGSTALDAATTVYINTPGAWYPSLNTDGTL